MDLLERLANLYVARSASPAPEALAAVAGKQAATVITGASQGLGFALARRLAREGRAVVLVARSQDSLREAAAELRNRYPKAMIVEEAIDVGTMDAYERVEELLQRHGLYLDVLVNNAGIALSGPFSVQDPTQIDQLLATNIAAVTRLTRMALPGMRARGRGGILNLSSLGAFTPGPWNAAYFASKAYVLSLTAAISAECAGEGVRICTVTFGPVRTQMLDELGGSRTHYKSLFASSSPERMARLAWRSYRLGRRVVVPGFTTTVLAWWVRAAPLGLLLPLVGWLMRPRLK
jgi:short-subunit dehydrogenase